MSRLFTLLLGSLLVLGAAGCTSKPVLNLSSPVANDVSIHSEEDVRDAIVRALQRRQWTVEQVGRERILAGITRRRHRADITVAYSASSYAINYRDSDNLGYRNGKIHRNYNNWVTHLDRTIRQELGNQAAPSATLTGTP